MTAALATTALTADEARHLTEQIRVRLDFLLPLIKQAFEGRADRALGYESWQAYCTAELGDVRVPLGDRPAMVAELRQAGMSTRAIGSALGVDDRTVRRDLSTAAHAAVPDRITGTDGREQPARRIQTPEPVAATSTAPAGSGSTTAPAASPPSPGADPAPAAEPAAEHAAPRQEPDPRPAPTLRLAPTEDEKRAAEQRDARGLLLRAVEILAPAHNRPGYAETWARQLGPYDAELSELIRRASEAIATLDDLIEGCGQ